MTIELDTIIQSDCLEYLQALPDSSVDCVVTSPPYYALRDYGVNGQIGLEQTPAEYIERLTAVFSEMRRVLKPSGTMWVNLGDSYGSGEVGRHDSVQGWRIDGKPVVKKFNKRQQAKTRNGLPAKSLLMIPARFAIRMQEDGWILRSDIIWHKRAPMPESVTDRPTQAHEHIFMFAKEPRYYFDQEAVKEKASYDGRKQTKAVRVAKYRNEELPDKMEFAAREHERWKKDSNGVRVRNIRNVWTLSPEPSSEEHYAAYPTEIPRRCILAGCPAGGLVLDMFTGTGTTAYVARQLGRHYLGCDISAEYVAMANRRLSQTDPMQPKTLPGGGKQLSLFGDNKP